ncbi:MAG: hypothetical protein GDA55_06830 [Cellvibrionales bacterium]|nr:hypothetical protein [Cellvibrionales bacterium]
MLRSLGNKSLWRDKLQAGGIHLLASALAVALILLGLHLFWFPAPLLRLGAVQGVSLILIVDLCIGPLLTVLVFRRGKPGLVLDLCLIVALQIAAMGYGVWAVHTQKPSFMVLTWSGLEVVSRYDLQRFVREPGREIATGVRESSLRYAGQIPVVWLDEPPTARERGAARFTFELNNSAHPYYFNTTQYRPLTALSAAPPVAAGQFTRVGDCYWLPFTSPHGQARACLAERDGRLVRVKSAPPAPETPPAK